MKLFRKIAFSKFDKIRIVWTGGVPTFMLPESHVAIHKCFLRWEQHGTHASFTQKFVNRPGHGTAQKHPFGIHPLAFDCR